MPDARTASPTSFSFPYISAVSMCRYPVWRAIPTAFAVSAGSIWKPPNPSCGIDVPSLSGMLGTAVIVEVSGSAGVVVGPAPEDEAASDSATHPTGPPLQASGRLLDDGQHVAGGVGEPGDVRAVAAHDAILILREALVALQLHAAAPQLGRRGADVRDGEVEDHVGRRGEVGLLVHQDPLTATELQGQQPRHLLDVGGPQAQRAGVELPGLGQVVHGEAAVGLGVLEHGRLRSVGCSSPVRPSGPLVLIGLESALAVDLEPHDLAGVDVVDPPAVGQQLDDAEPAPVQGLVVALGALGMADVVVADLDPHGVRLYEHAQPSLAAAVDDRVRHGLAGQQGDRVAQVLVDAGRLAVVVDEAARPAYRGEVRRQYQVGHAGARARGWRWRGNVARRAA